MAVAGGSPLNNPLLQLAGFAIGTAIGPVLRPGVQDLANFAWSEHPVRPLDAQTAAAMVVEGVWTFDRAVTEASYTGVGQGRLEALRQLIDNPPDVSTLLALWRRNLISADKFREGLRHLRIETDYFDAIVATHNALLTPEQLANARQRGFITQARQYSEAELQGITNDRAEVAFELSGLPPPPERAREMWRRGILTEREFRQAIVEGNEKIKYVDEEVALFRPLLTTTQIVNQRLRGWRDTAWMNARLAEHGLSVEQATDLFEGQGRPLSFHQVFIGERRGGTYNGDVGALSPAFLKSLQESNVRPEWYNLAWAQRHSYPSAFVLRALVQSGDLTEQDGLAILLRIGWPQDLAEKVAARWAGGTGAAATDPLVKSQQTNVITRIRNAYLQRRATDAQARDWLGALGIAAAVQTGMIAAWDVGREVPGSGLTRTQVKKAFQNLPTEWPRQRALDELEMQGMEPEEAQTFLDE